METHFLKYVIAMHFMYNVIIYLFSYPPNLLGEIVYSQIIFM